MLIPSILPEELAHGYLGRIRAINILTNTKVTASIIERSFLKEEKNLGKAKCAFALAEAAEMTLEQFCQLHTLMPFLRVATIPIPETPHGSNVRLGLVGKSGLRLAVPHSMACPECIQEDLSYWGFAYWRRQHQLTGVPWCEKHRAALINTAGGFDVCPSTPDGIQHQEEASEFHETIENPVINRYVEIATGFLDCSKALSLAQASNKLSRRAQEKAIRVAKNGRRSNLSDIALDSVPIKWLAGILPGIDAKKPGEFFHGLDIVVRHGGLSHAHALALALLFDSAEEALKYWINPLPEDTSKLDGDVINGQDFWNSRKVFSTYVKSGGNRSEIGRVLCIHSRRVSGELDRTGLPSLANVDLETTGQALLSFYNGRTLSEACAMHGANYTTCEELIRQAGARFAEALRRIMRAPASNRCEPMEAAAEDFRGSQTKEMADKIIKTWVLGKAIV